MAGGQWRLGQGTNIWRDARSGDFLLSKPDSVDARPLRRPRIGLYKSYVPSMDEGWTRWLLEKFGFKYTSVYNTDLQAAISGRSSM